MVNEGTHNSSPYDVLKYGFWNIEGYKTKVIGNKLIHKDFIQKVGNRDIIGLAETHIHNLTLEYFSIPGFTIVKPGMENILMLDYEYVFQLDLLCHDFQLFV